MSRLSLSVALCCLSCGTAEERFEVKYVSGFVPSAMTVSVLGVLQDGLMTEAPEAVLGPSIFRAFQNDACAVAFNEGLGRLNPGLFSYIDRQAKDNGITDDLFEKVASHADGDFMVAFQVSGRPPARSEGTPDPRPLLIAHGGDMGGLGAAPRREPRPPEAFEVATLLFSLRLHRTVALVTMVYSGASVADAMNRLSAKLGVAFPGARCAGWKIPAAPAPSPEESTRPRSNAGPRAVL